MNNNVWKDLSVRGQQHPQPKRQHTVYVNKKNKSSIVYKIQLYNGYETEAYKIKRNFEASFPEYKTFIDASKQPDWKTQVGNFNTRIEADRVLIIIKDKFSGAIVLEDKIQQFYP